MARRGEKVATAVKIPRIKTDITVTEAAMRLALRAETILEIMDFSISRATSLRGALASGLPGITALAGLFFF
jgi:hypothetical protein